MIIYTQRQIRACGALKKCFGWSKLTPKLGAWETLHLENKLRAGKARNEYSAAKTRLEFILRTVLPLCDEYLVCVRMNCVHFFGMAKVGLSGQLRAVIWE